jgi:hypothetical protein
VADLERRRSDFTCSIDDSLTDDFVAEAVAVYELAGGPKWQGGLHEGGGFVAAHISSTVLRGADQCHSLKDSALHQRLCRDSTGGIMIWACRDIRSEPFDSAFDAWEG